MDAALSVGQGALGKVKVSVVIPVYNVARYLTRCLDSVRAAAAAAPCETEIICVNDGSTDGSAELLVNYADAVTIITKENGGLGSARNAGLDAMTGDYVTFVDSDDWIPPYAIARFAEVAEASGAALTVSTSFAKDAVRTGSDTTSWTMRPAEWISGKKVQYCAWNKLYRADLFRTRRYPATIYEDFPVTTDIFRETGEFAAIDAPLYVYCTNAGATSLVRSAFSERKMRDSLSVVRMALEAAKGREREAFSRVQAADGLSSTVGQVYKAGDAAITRAFIDGLDALLTDYPAMAGALSVKARFRLWRLRAGVRR